VNGNYITSGAEHGKIGRVGRHDRIVVNYRGLDVENLIRSKIEGRKGRSVISRKSVYEEMPNLRLTT